MPCIKVRDEKHWHQLRAKHIGGSEIAGLMGCSPWHTPNQLFLDKSQFVYFPVGGPLVEFGKAMEPIIAYMLAQENGWTVEKNEDYLEHPDYPFLGATLDYRILESEHGEGLLEVKNAIVYAPGWSQTHAPEYVEWQLQHELLVANAVRREMGLRPYDFGAIGSMHGGNPEDLRTMLRPPDADMQRLIIERSNRLTLDIEAGRMPDALEPKDYEYVSTVWRAAESVIGRVDLMENEQAELEAAQYLDAREKAKHYDTLSMAMKAKLMHRMLSVQDKKLLSRVEASTSGHNITVAVGKNVRFKVKPVTDGEEDMAGKPPRKPPADAPAIPAAAPVPETPGKKSEFQAMIDDAREGMAALESVATPEEARGGTSNSRPIAPANVTEREETPKNPPAVTEMLPNGKEENNNPVTDRKPEPAGQPAKADFPSPLAPRKPPAAEPRPAGEMTVQEVLLNAKVKERDAEIAVLRHESGRLKTHIVAVEAQRDTWVQIYDRQADMFNAMLQAIGGVTQLQRAHKSTVHELAEELRKKA